MLMLQEESQLWDWSESSSHLMQHHSLQRAVTSGEEGGGRWKYGELFWGRTEVERGLSQAFSFCHLLSVHFPDVVEEMQEEKETEKVQESEEGEVDFCLGTETIKHVLFEWVFSNNFGRNWIKRLFFGATWLGQGFSIMYFKFEREKLYKVLELVSIVKANLWEI